MQGVDWVFHVAAVSDYWRQRGTALLYRVNVGGTRNVLEAALAAGVRGRNRDLKRFYDRLIANGKPAKVAIAAVMRKLVILANTLLTEDRCWIEKPA